MMSSASRNFPTDPAGLTRSVAPPTVELAHGDSFDLRIAAVAKQLGESTVRMLAYNGSIPGPTLKVEQGSEIVVNVENQGDLEATVHWHGLRLDNRYDGTHETQEPIPVGGRFQYRLEFPDPGIYWYHPHVRQDYGQEMGLYGCILVEPAEPDYWPPVHREVVLTLDDILLEDGRVAPFSPTKTTYSAMGRFGNHMLVSGELEQVLTARAGEVVRFYLANTANTRVFNVASAGGRMKLVGGDSGRCEHEEFIESVVLGPSERVIVDVLLEAAGEAALEHRTPHQTYKLATIAVGDEPVDPPPAAAFDALRTNAEMVAERERIAADLERDPDRTVAFVAEMEFEAPEGPVVYSCPMHPEVVSSEPGKCPHCAMKLVPSSLVEAAGGHTHPHGEHTHDHSATADGIEWEDDMVEVNRTTTSANTRWKVVDRTAGGGSDQVSWQFKVGDRVKIRLVNEMDSDHPMHHPFHIHGAGRFLVLSRDGAVETNLVWTDTVLVRTGETVDILLDVTHPGRWMAHCHIAEHHESGMAFSFDVVG